MSENCTALGGKDPAGRGGKKKYLTAAGVLLLIREVQCGILGLSEGHAPDCPIQELRLRGSPDTGE